MANLYYPFSWYTECGGKTPTKKILNAANKIEEKTSGKHFTYDISKNLDFHQEGVLLSNREDLTQEQVDSIWAYAEFYEDREEEEEIDIELELCSFGIKTKEIIFKRNTY